MLSMPKTQSRNDLSGLELVGAVVEAGSFSGAGAALGLAQSAVSRKVAAVEDRLGVRLFHRTARSIALTAEGRQFYAKVAPHLEAIADAANEATSAARTMRGTVRVVVSPGVGELVAAHLPQFIATYPELVLELITRDRIGDLVRDNIDIAVKFGPPERSALKARLLLRTRILTCASPGYLGVHGTPRVPTDLKEHRCILMRDASTNAVFGWELHRPKKIVRVPVRGNLIVNSGQAMIAACCAGVGIAQLLELYVHHHLLAKRLVQVLPQWAEETYPLYAYFQGGAAPSARVRTVLDFLASAFSGAAR